MRILVTGFEPFGAHAVNSSAAVVHALPASDRLIRRVLPTVYADSGRILCELIRDEAPDAVVCLGLRGDASSILLERTAVNLNHDTCGDNAGDCAQQRIIHSHGPASYASTLPLTTMHAALRERGIPVGYSDTAGTYVCNHVFYTARHLMEQRGDRRPCGFIHLPQAGERGLPLEVLVDGIETCLRVIAREASAK
jgi:pyroglutamyl-peptidase